MIYYYRNKIDQNNKLKKRFETLKDNLNNSVIPSLNGIKSTLDNADELMGNAYVLNGSGADNGSISNNSSKVEDVKNYISNNVIPAINNKIRDLRNTIYYYQDLLEKEKNKEEE